MALWFALNLLMLIESICGLFILRGVPFGRTAPASAACDHKIYLADPVASPHGKTTCSQNMQLSAISMTSKYDNYVNRSVIMPLFL